MKQKISITLSKKLLNAIDRVAGSRLSRPDFIERVLGSYFRERALAARHARDLEIINRAADRLNLEAADVLDFQASEP
jgi:metal-responsive CopG/Arc/MetJ family transcriptional regulator